jgi:hypothetical protein
MVNRNENKYIYKDEPKYKNFIKWLESNGAIFNFEYPIAYTKFNIIGVSAVNQINHNEAILYIPKKLIIDSSQIKNKKFKDNSIIKLVLFILEEYMKGQFSFWYPYLSLIGDESLPIFWDHKFLNELQDDYLVESIIQLKNDLYLNYTSLVDEILDKDKVDIELFMKVYAFVVSRNFYISDEQSLMVPLADCLNHYTVDVKYEFYDCENFVFKYTYELDEDVKLVKTDNTLFLKNKNNTFIESDNLTQLAEESDILTINDTDYFVISTAEQKFSQGEQVYNFYGEFSNVYLLKWYGFCFINNKHDKVKIRINLPKGDDLLFEKYINTLFPDNLIDSEDNIILKFSLKNTINIDLVKYVRFFLFYENDIVDKYFSYKSDPLLEFEVIRRYIELLNMTLHQTTSITTIDDDLLLLNNLIESQNDNKLSFIFYNIVIYRLTKKLLIAKNIEYGNSILKILQSNQNAENCFNFEEIAAYFKN